MKNKIFNGIFFIALLVGLFTVMSFASFDRKTSENADTIDVPYEYPVLPGTSEWVALGTYQNRLASCQIPEDTLQKLSTDALVQTILNYPFKMNLYAYEDLQKGYERLRAHFNGLQELEYREDGLAVLQSYSQAVALLEESEKTVKEFFLEDLYRIYSNDLAS